jgi:hypothetical protein
MDEGEGLEEAGEVKGLGILGTVLGSLGGGGGKG